MRFIFSQPGDRLLSFIGGFYSRMMVVMVYGLFMVVLVRVIFSQHFDRFLTFFSFLIFFFDFAEKWTLLIGFDRYLILIGFNQSSASLTVLMVYDIFWSASTKDLLHLPTN